MLTYLLVLACAVIITSLFLELFIFEKMDLFKKEKKGAEN